ncbi:MAG: beta-ketoacyl-[acyl-carrier-protein] synthase family protein [Candidatus Omnitrophica bacterium]|nr:beta-ketoacyl-[acyl-carrier-protein] synthase family protein [Candidatus Omnitrophota bacterium]
MNRRVVITGAGVVSPIGIGLPAFTEGLRTGRRGDGPISSFPSETCAFKYACEVKNFDGRFHGTRQLDPFIQYALKAADEALKDACFNPAQADPYRVALSVSSSKGGMHTLDQFKGRFAKRPSAILGARIYANLAPNLAAQWIARRWKIHGPAKCYIAACATGTVAVEQGALMVAEGAADYCLAGASDASIVPLMLAGYRQMNALSSSRMRPFHRKRDGFLVGEGAGMVFLESLESARARGAHIYAEVLGGAQGTDSTHALHFHPEEDALSRTVKKLLCKIDRKPSDIGYVNLHGTATRAGDIYETEQLKKAFGSQAGQIPMSATKAMTGHMLGASGAVEIVACLMSLQNRFLPPTIGLDDPDPVCDLDYVANESRKAEVETAISVSMGFGGHVAVLALGKI